MSILINLGKTVPNKTPPSEQFLASLAFKLGCMAGIISKAIKIGKAGADIEALLGNSLKQQYWLGGVAELEDWRDHLIDLTEFCATEWNKPKLPEGGWQTGTMPTSGYFLAQLDTHKVISHADCIRVVHWVSGSLRLAGNTNMNPFDPKDVVRWKPI